MTTLSPGRLVAFACLTCLAPSTACGDDGADSTGGGSPGSGGAGGAATTASGTASTSSTGGADASTGGPGGSTQGTGGEAAGGASAGPGGGGGAGGAEPQSACEKYCAAAKEAMCPPGDDPACVEDCHYEAQLAQEDGCDKQFEALVLCKATNGDVCNPTACAPLEVDYDNCTVENGGGSAR